MSFKWGLTYVLYRKTNNSFDINENVLLSIARILVALAAALSHCRDGFRDDVTQSPKSFSELTSHKSIQEPGEPEISIKYNIQNGNFWFSRFLYRFM